ncbi:MAG: 50S ribosomal protein L7/L12 [Candidatus Cloacimonetes bacterium]|nr:50S ribosomal protein L7/L12 [Candidatus Cloacimonadota bacterium]
MAEETKQPKLPKKLESIITEIEKLTILEAADLVKALQEKFGVTAAAPTVVAPAAVAEEETKKEEKNTYDVILQSAGENKIAVIKVLREIKPDLGLKEAKTLTEEAPKAILEDAKKEEAEEVKKKLEAAGAKVELK